MERLKERFLSFRYKGILAVLLVFAVITVILFLERSGIKFNYERRAVELLPDDKVVSKKSAFESMARNNLVIRNSESSDSNLAFRQFEIIFQDMKIGYDTVDIAKEQMPELDGYETLTVILSDLTPLGEGVIHLSDWVYNGGNVLFPMTLEKSIYTSIIENKLGIIDSSYANAPVESVYIEADFMIGGGRAFTIPDGYDSGWAVQLSEKNNTVVHAYTADERRMPLVWSTDYGKGRFVVDNFGIYTKSMRGFFAASYSLLTDVAVYPVINGSTFYLDDFPSQIPSGNSSYIQRDYNTTIRDFYVNIWWPDMMNIADKYGIKYTGLAIECYDDAVDGTTDAAPDTGTFLNFGNMLMRQGGEIGYHGYNHQPLCFDNCDYRGIYDYKTWENYGAMKSAFDELVDFCDELFPGVNMAIYVPPSNLLSIEGRNFLLTEYPWIKTVSGIYFEDDDLEFSCTQEYDVSEDGVVDQPRVISGCALTPFMELAAVSELNFHFINNHFTHPDDALDPDRGAEMGWEKLKTRFYEFLDWLYGSAPSLRNFTGTEMSGAVQRFAAITPEKEIGENEMVLRLGNFYDQAHLLLRFNKREAIDAKGGRLTHLTGDLYLLEATEDTVRISLK